MIDNSESVNCANVWWILEADYFTIEGIMNDFRQKYPAHWFREEKMMQRNSCEKQYPALKKISLMTYNAGKKSYTIICRGKNISSSRSLGKIITLTKSPVPPSPQTSNGHVNH